MGKSLIDEYNALLEESNGVEVEWELEMKDYLPKELRYTFYDKLLEESEKDK